MNSRTIFAAACLAASTLTLPASAQNDKSLCRKVSGHGTWTLIASPGDPLGRVLGPTTGTLKAAVSAYLTTLLPQPTGEILASSVETWALDEDDFDSRPPKAIPSRNTLTFNGKAIFTPVAGQPVGTVTDALTLTVASGTGDYVNATGSLQVTGTGFNVFGPNAAPGNTFFKIRYEGRICRAK